MTAIIYSSVNPYNMAQILSGLQPFAKTYQNYGLCRSLILLCFNNAIWERTNKQTASLLNSSSSQLFTSFFTFFFSSFLLFIEMTNFSLDNLLEGHTKPSKSHYILIYSLSWQKDTDQNHQRRKKPMVKFQKKIHTSFQVSPPGAVTWGCTQFPKQQYLTKHAKCCQPEEYNQALLSRVFNGRLARQAWNTHLTDFSSQALTIPNLNPRNRNRH